MSESASRSEELARDRTSQGATSSALLLPTLIYLACVTSVVSSLGAPLVPDIATRYDVSLSAAQWTLTSALVVGAVTSPLIGRLGGNRRRKSVVLVGLGCVAAGLLMSALPTGFATLVTGRALQGVGLALFPLVIASAREGLPRHRTRSAISMLSVASAAGAGIGYPVTAWVAGRFGLGSAFWLALAFTLIGWILASWVLPASAGHDLDRVDWCGGVLLALGIVAALLALALVPRQGWLSPVIVALFATAGGTVALWVRRSLRHDFPLVDLRMAGQRATLPAHATAFCGGVALYMIFALVMLSVQLPRSTGFGLGRSPGIAGTMLVPYAVTAVLSSRLAVLLGRWMRGDLVLSMGAALYVAGAVTCAGAHGSIAELLVVMALVGTGSGLLFGALPGLVIGATPMSETGSAVAFNQLLRFLGFSLGSTLAATCLELFSEGLVPDEHAFSSSVMIAAALGAVTALVPLFLPPPRRGRRPR